MLNINQCKAILKVLGGSISAITAHHYGSQYLGKIDDRFFNVSNSDSTNESAVTIDNGEIIESTQKNVEAIMTFVKNVQEQCKMLNQNKNSDFIRTFKEKVMDLKSDGELLSKVLENQSLPNKEDIGLHITQNMSVKLDGLMKLVDDLEKRGNQLVSNFNFSGIDLNIFYNYLDTLSLQQEGALFHIIVLSTIMLTAFSILGIFFGNEIIQYLNLEKKYPKLSRYLRVRAKLQRYYLMWNMLLLFGLCTMALLIDILVFATG